MIRAAIAAATFFSGCASLHSSLGAEIDADYDATSAYEARCLTRDDEGRTTGVELSFELGTSDKGPVVVMEEDDVAIWGRGTTSSSVAYSYGQICRTPHGCIDYLVLEDTERRVWMHIDTTRPAPDPATFEAQLQEGRLIDQAAVLVNNERQRKVFDRVSTELESAADTRDSILGKMFFGIGSMVTEISASVTEASATIDAQIQLSGLMSFLAEHNVVLYGGRKGELRLFEVVQTICISPLRTPAVAWLGPTK